ncbi:MaoC family dehydratase N-terminal domain-containing protein [Alcaligenaceae bacterium]|nr:MaoC family dehydratase N-terminal domain-containing protein [Alcaligenaceae bacterium]
MFSLKRLATAPDPFDGIQHMVEPIYYEDLTLGDIYLAPERIIVEEDLSLFAQVSGDDHPIHTSDTYAQSTPFKRRIAHGPFGIAMAIGQFGRIPGFQETAIAMTNVNNWKFRIPIYVGDEITVEVCILNKALRGPCVGLIERGFRLTKADGTVAQEGRSSMLIARRPPL